MFLGGTKDEFLVEIVYFLALLLDFGILWHFFGWTMSDRGIKDFQTVDSSEIN